MHLDILEAHSSLLEGMLLNGEADLAFFNLPVKSPDIDYEIISHEEVVLVLAADHPLKDAGIKKEGCKYPWLDLHLLADEPFILQPSGQRTRQTVDQLFKTCHFHPQVRLPDQQYFRCCGTGFPRVCGVFRDRDPFETYSI